MTTDTAWTELNGTRVVFYRWLSGVFARELSAEDIDNYRDGEGWELLEDLCADPSMSDSVRKVMAVLTREDNVADLSIDLAAAFANLFLGVGGRRSAPPYESYYTDEKGLLYQEATQAMAVLLERYDVHVDEGFREPADHISIQLELMAVLATGGAQMDPDTTEVRSLVEAQAEILDTHLLNWIPTFADDCAAHDTSGLYAGLAGILMAFLNADRSLCGAWLEND